MKDGVDSLGRVRTQALVLLAIAFLAGAFVGGTVERVLARPSRAALAAAARGGPRGGPLGAGRAPRTPGALPGSYESLGLTPDQRSKIEAILAKRSARVDSAMKSVCVVIGPARDSSSKEVDQVLTAEQRTKRDSIRASRPTGRGGARVGPFGCAMPGAGPGRGN